jgi:hypothetical protein
MAAIPQRRKLPARHLPAQLVPLERALLTRADAIEQTSADVRDAGLGDHARALMAIAAEFLALAEEMHHW